MEIRFRPNVALVGIPETIVLDEGACLRDALKIVIPQIVDDKTGDYKDDPDIWGIKLNNVSFWQLQQGMNTSLTDGDVINYEVRFCLC